MLEEKNWFKKHLQKMHLVTIIGTWKALCSSQFRFFFPFNCSAKEKGTKKKSLGQIFDLIL